MSKKTPWLKIFNPQSQTKLRLFCLPYCGGGTSIFRDWSNNLPANVEVCGLRLPGRENRILETPFQELSILIQALEKALLPHLQKVPFAFFGHSMGALIAFELTRALRRQNNLQPVHLFVSGFRAPNSANPMDSWGEISPDFVLEELRKLGGIPERVLNNPDILQKILPTIYADIHIVKTYTYKEETPLDCPISALGGSEDGLFSHQSIACWKQQTQNYFHLQMFPGDHFFLHNAQTSLLNYLSQEIKKYLSEV
ncbi:MAG: thioesterase domain-containing protein [Cyanobacteria bacterium P01_A01_bin.84]